MADSRFVGQNMFGTQSTSRSKTHYPPWRYVLSLFVVVVAGLYAIPNLFPPDYAIQIQTDNQKNPAGERFNIGTNFIERVVEIVEEDGISVKARELLDDDDGALIRFNSEIDRDQAKLLLESRLNPEGRDRQFVVALSLADTAPKWLQRIGGRPMTLGLDLAGGIHFVLQVDMDTSINNQMMDESEKVLSRLREARIRYVSGQDIVTGQSLTIQFADEVIRDSAISMLREFYGLPNYELTTTRTADNPSIQLSLTSDRIRELEDLAIDQNLDGLRNRVNELNVSEPLVQRLGRNRIVIDLPGVQDSSRAKRILDKFATLEFRLVGKIDDRPSDLEQFPYKGRMQDIQREVIVEGKNVINATPGRDEHGLPQVNFTLDRAGGDRMHDVTKDHVNHSMAILFIEKKPVVSSEIVDGVRVETTRIVEDRRLISVANINSPLSYNSRITGLSASEAKDLSLLLRAGALAAPMYFVEERTVGASLGEENIRRGFTAVVIGFLLVLTFMLVYYKVFGIVANVALTLNLIIVIAVMSSIGATLTLPGIAGMVLTVGMAVDANVLIFSRIREELKVSKPWTAIPAGYDRAFRTILDANLTTLFVALILLFLGSGPIAGFAVTLSIGIVTSMFTAIFVSRGIVHLIYGRPNVEKVWI